MTNSNKTNNTSFLFLRFFTLIIVVFLGSSYFSCHSEAQSFADQVQSLNRDWAKYPAIVELETTSEIFAIGDIHGDYEGLLELLVASEIISEIPNKPNRVKWEAGEAILVIPGDFISKGPQSVEVIYLLQELQKSAAKKGGQVILTFGNHEAEFLANPKDSKIKAFRKELQSLDISPKAVARGEDKTGIGKFIRNLPFAAKINDWYFVHAGNPKKYTLPELESKIIKSVEKEGFGASVLLDKDKGILEVRMNPRPWWEKKDDNAKESKSRLRNLINELGVNHMVVGHQPGKYNFSDGETRKAGKMDQKFNGMIFFIDTGMESKKSGGAVLNVQKIDGKEKASIVYPGKQKKKRIVV